eukprot:gene30605-52780_t
MFQLTQDKCSLADGVNTNDQIEVSFNLRGREWTSPQGEVKYFNTLEAWRIDKMGSNGGGMPQGGPSAMNLDPISATNVSLKTKKVVINTTVTELIGIKIAATSGVNFPDKAKLKPK